MKTWNVGIDIAHPSLLKNTNETWWKYGVSIERERIFNPWKFQPSIFYRWWENHVIPLSNRRTDEQTDIPMDRHTDEWTDNGRRDILNYRASLLLKNRWIG